MRRVVKSVRDDESGASLIEFALFLPVLAMMVMGISDVAMGYARKLTVESAAYRSLEKVSISPSQSSFATLRAEAAAAAGVDQSAVTIDTWLECDRARQTDINGSCATGAEMARYVSVEIDAFYAPEFNYGPLARGFANDDGQVPIGAIAAVRFQ